MWLLLQIPDAHPLGATAVTWSPAAPPGSLVSAKAPGQPEKRIASSGADNTVKVGAHQHACLQSGCVLVAVVVQRIGGLHAGVALQREDWGVATGGP